MSNHSIIEHRANYHFFKMEEDYVSICTFGVQYPQCKAAILAVLEHWIDDKRLKGQEEFVYMTYPEWIDALYGLFRRNTIMACINELIAEGLITRRPIRRHGKDTFEYTLNIQEVQQRLKQLPERTDKNTRPNLNASKFKRVQKQTGVNLDGTTNPNLNGSEHEDPSKNKRNIDSSSQNPDTLDSSNRVAGDTTAFAQVSPATPPALFAHPVYDFLFFDNLERPTLMVISFIDDERAEITNDGYALTADMVEQELIERGFPVQIRSEYRPANLVTYEAGWKRVTDERKAVGAGIKLASAIPDDPEKTVEREDNGSRQPFNVSANTDTPLYPIANNGYTPTDTTEQPASPPVLQANGYMNQPPMEGDTLDASRDSDRSGSAGNHTPGASRAVLPDHDAHGNRTAHLVQAGQAHTAVTEGDTHDSSPAHDSGRRHSGDSSGGTERVTQGDGNAALHDVGDRGATPDPSGRMGTSALVRVRPAGATAASVGSAHLAGIPAHGDTTQQDTSVASVDPAATRGEQTQGGATASNPPSGSESRAPGREETRSQSGETYATVEAWQAGRDGYAATLAAQWEGLDPASRKQRHNRFDWYRSAMLKEWETAHPKPSAITLLEPVLTPEQVARCRAWYQRFIDLRGYAWETQGEVINEHKYIKRLVVKYTDAQIERLYDYLFNRHFKWSKPDFRYKIGAYVVYSEAPSVIQALKAEQQSMSLGNGHRAIPTGTSEYGGKPRQDFTGAGAALRKARQG